jgi:hypothetical protein
MDSGGEAHGNKMHAARKDAIDAKRGNEIFPCALYTQKERRCIPHVQSVTIAHTTEILHLLCLVLCACM